MKSELTINDKPLRILNRFIWQRLCQFLPEGKNRGRSSSDIMIYGYAGIAMCNQDELLTAMKSDDGFFDIMAIYATNLLDEDIEKIASYVQDVYDKLEAAQTDVVSEGK
jgi:hypothetical protein